MVRGKTILLASLLVLPTIALAQTDPLDPSFMPSIDTNAADYPSNIWITGPLAKVLQNTGSPGTTHWAIIYSAQNEFQSFQVHVHDTGSGIPNLNVTMSDLVNAQTGTHISASSTDIIVYREAYLNITNITAVSKTFYGITGYYPDILIPAIDPYYHQTTNAFPFNVAANQNQSMWIDVHIPTSGPSGYYSGTVTVKSGSTVLATMPVLYAVWNWQMPPTATLLSINGTGFPAMCKQMNNSASGDTGCAAYPGAGGNGDTGFILSQIDLAVMMLDHRQSLTTNVYPPLPSAPPYTTFESNYGPLLSGTAANTATILPGAKAITLGPWFASAISQTSAQNAMNEFASKGWGSTLFDYTCDEPPNGCSWAALISNATGPHAASPQVPTLVTTDIAALTANGALNAVDWMVPIINQMDPQGGSLQRSSYDAWLAGSPIRKLFSYQSCSSAGTCTNGFTGGSNATWPNYDVDGTPVANRAMEWLTYLHQQTGELYYDATYCWTGSPTLCGPSGATTLDPWTSVYYSGGNGDGTLIYPGTQAKIGVTKPIFLPSIRLKMRRDGMQDYEYMYALNAAGQGALVTTQINSWITNSYTFNNDPNNNGTYTGTLTSARQALGTKLHQLNIGSGVTTTTATTTTTTTTTTAISTTSSTTTTLTKQTRVLLSQSASGTTIGAIATAKAVTIPNQVTLVIKTNDPAFPNGAVLSVSIDLPSGTKTFTLTQLDTSTYYTSVSNASFSPADFAMNNAAVNVTVGTLNFATAGQGNAVTSALGGMMTDSTSLSQVIIAPGGITQDAQIAINPMPSDVGGARASALQKQHLSLLGNGQDIVFSSPGTLSAATLILPFDPTLIPKNITTPQIAIAYFNANTGAWEIQNGTIVIGNELKTQVSHFSPYAPVLILPNSTPSLKNAYVYPSPAVTPQDPTIRAILGVVDSLDITIFDVSGRKVFSTTLTGAPTGVVNGDYYYDYAWTGSKASGVYYAVIHGHAANGTIIRARAQFSVIR